MKRSPIARKKPMARGSKLIERKAPLRKINKVRRAMLWARQFHSVERVLWVNSLPCATCAGGCGPIQNSHVKTRGAGGDYTSIIPQGADCHREMDDVNSGIETFCQRRGITVDDLRQMARDVEAAWQQHQLRGATQ